MDRMFTQEKHSLFFLAADHNNELLYLIFTYATYLTNFTCDFCKKMLFVFQTIIFVFQTRIIIEPFDLLC